MKINQWLKKTILGGAILAAAAIPILGISSQAQAQIGWRSHGSHYGRHWRHCRPHYHRPSLHYHRTYHHDYWHWTPSRGLHSHGHYHYTPHYTPGHWHY